MASIDDIQAVFNTIVQVLDETRLKEAITTANDLKALVRDRVQNDKVKSDGQPFGQYSTAPVPYWFYTDKESNVSDSAKKLLDTVGYFASYADFREVNNVQAGDIDLTLTGQMWASTTVVEGDISDGQATAIIQFTGESNKLKAGYHGDRFGNILAASDEEINAVIESYRERRFELIGALLGG